MSGMLVWVRLQKDSTSHDQTASIHDDYMTTTRPFFPCLCSQLFLHYPPHSFLPLTLFTLQIKDVIRRSIISVVLATDM